VWRGYDLRRLKAEFPACIAGFRLSKLEQFPESAKRLSVPSVLGSTIEVQCSSMDF
jgi:hypothetical protein